MLTVLVTSPVAEAGRLERAEDGEFHYRRLGIGRDAMLLAVPGHVSGGGEFRPRAGRYVAGLEQDAQSWWSPAMGQEWDEVEKC